MLDLVVLASARSGGRREFGTKQNRVQEKSYNPEKFSVRFEQLQAATGHSTSYLCKNIGISRTHLYHLKNGKQDPTAKVWHKLEAAEKAAAESDNPVPLANNSGNPNDFSGPDAEKLEDGSAEYRAARAAALAAGLARAERDSAAAKGVLTEAMRDLYSVLGALAGSGPQVSPALVRTAQDRITQFAEEIANQRQNHPTEPTSTEPTP